MKIVGHLTAGTVFEADDGRTYIVGQLAAGATREPHYVAGIMTKEAHGKLDLNEVVADAPRPTRGNRV